jgi:hypothetical protein
MGSQQAPPGPLLEAIENLARFHHAHEEFYSQAPLQSAVRVQASSRVLKALAARWSTVEPTEHRVASPYAGSEDLNPPGVTEESGVLFMEGEAEPPEIAAMRRDLGLLAEDLERTGQWLAKAMEQSWGIAGSLAAYPALADLLGERHRIIINDWQAAELQALVSRVLRRALDLLDPIEFSPDALRADIAGERVVAAYLYSASELLDRASDLIVDSAVLVHDNERRWRVFSRRVEELIHDRRVD